MNYLYGVQGVECSNHSVPTKSPQKIQSLNGDWIFLCLRFCDASEFSRFLLAAEVCRVCERSGYKSSSSCRVAMRGNGFVASVWLSGGKIAVARGARLFSGVVSFAASGLIISLLVVPVLRKAPSLL
jgi:hypothetical protein